MLRQERPEKRKNKMTSRSLTPARGCKRKEYIATSIDVYHMAIGNSLANTLHFEHTTIEIDDTGLFFTIDNVSTFQLPWNECLAIEGFENNTSLNGFHLGVIQWARNVTTYEFTQYCDR